MRALHHDNRIRMFVMKTNSALRNRLPLHLRQQTRRPKISSTGPPNNRNETSIDNPTNDDPTTTDPMLFKRIDADHRRRELLIITAIDPRKEIIAGITLGTETTPGAATTAETTARNPVTVIRDAAVTPEIVDDPTSLGESRRISINALRYVTIVFWIFADATRSNLTLRISSKVHANFARNSNEPPAYHKSKSTPSTANPYQQPTLNNEPLFFD